MVGFLGDGINDSPALKAADVGISVDTAVDIAKESADIILLEKSLMVLQEGVIEGRKIFANITKYIKMGASSNFGNMFSVLGASIFLPFLPMAPIQVLTNNLLYDFSQTAIPTDNVDEEYLAAPRRWDIGNIFKFMLFIGPISSIFDYATYRHDAFRLRLLEQSVALPDGLVRGIAADPDADHPHHPHGQIPFVESRASAALITTTIIICSSGSPFPSRAGSCARLYAASPALLALGREHAAYLRGADPFGEGMVRPPLGDVTAPANAAATGRKNSGQCDSQRAISGQIRTRISLPMNKPRCPHGATALWIEHR